MKLSDIALEFVEEVDFDQIKDLKMFQYKSLGKFVAQVSFMFKGVNVGLEEVTGKREPNALDFAILLKAVWHSVNKSHAHQPQNQPHSDSQ